MASTGQHTKKHFRFFDLPRELRDEIYAFLHTTSLKIPSAQHRVYPARITIKGGLHSNLQLVNKQFRVEYEERHPGHSTLVVDTTKWPFVVGFHRASEKVDDCADLELSIRGFSTEKNSYQDPARLAMGDQMGTIRFALDALPNIRRVELRVLFKQPLESLEEWFRRCGGSFLEDVLDEEEIRVVKIFSAAAASSKDTESAAPKQKECQLLGKWERDDLEKYIRSIR